MTQRQNDTDRSTVMDTDRRRSADRLTQTERLTDGHRDTVGQRQRDGCSVLAELSKEIGVLKSVSAG